MWISPGVSFNIHFMKKQWRITWLSFCCCVVLFQKLAAQELFVYTEPASNMATKSIGIRATNILSAKNTSGYQYQLQPEIMFGLSKKIMLHAEGFFSNRSNQFNAEGAALYLKYRFYSSDEVHSHFRMAGFARAAYNNGYIQQPAIDLNGQNSGYEAGAVATRLINKLALSATASYLHAFDNGSGNKFINTGSGRNAINYTLSAGRLILPKSYDNYEQTNMNLMLELLGQLNTYSYKSYLDMAPSVQFIFLSKIRLDLGYRFAVLNDLDRETQNGFLLRLEYNFFNAFK